jgi:hypothetical protein
MFFISELRRLPSSSQAGGRPSLRFDAPSEFRHVASSFPIPQKEKNHSKRRGAGALQFDYIGKIAVVAAGISVLD